MNLDKIRILIVEDETVVGQRLMRMLHSILGEGACPIHHVEDLREAQGYLQRHTIDLLFLDLNLNGKDGFRIFTEAVAGSFQTIIVSAHSDQAIRAFEYGAVDFVAKPFSEERLRKAVDRFRDGTRRQETKYVAAKKAGVLQFIPIKEILYLKGADDYSEIHCRDGATYLHDKSLSSLQQILPDFFQRLHRSFLVNMQFVTGQENRAGSRYFVLLQNGDRLRLSRKKLDFLRTYLRP